MQRTRIGIIRGGPTPAYDLSLKTGAALITALPEERYEARDIFIDRQGIWYVRGRATPPSRALAQLDSAVVAIHGAYGEDGRIQRVLESHSVPYVGADPFSSALAFSKPIAKERMRALGAMTAVGTIVEADGLSRQRIIALFREFPQPSVIKPQNGGSSIGVFVARNYFEFERALVTALASAPSVLLEEYIRGTEATVGTLEGFRGESLYALPPVEIASDPAAGHFTYEAKLAPNARHRAFGAFSSDEKQELATLAKKAHAGLGLRDIGRHDFVVAKRGIVYLESNSVPEMFPDSPFQVALESVGAKVSHALEHMVGRSLAR